MKTNDKAQRLHDNRRIHVEQLIEDLPDYARPFVEDYRPVVTQWCRLAGCCEHQAMIEFIGKVRKMLDDQYQANIAGLKVWGHKSTSSGV